MGRIRVLHMTWAKCSNLDIRWSDGKKRNLLFQFQPPADLSQRYTFCEINSGFPSDPPPSLVRKPQKRVRCFDTQLSVLQSRTETFLKHSLLLMPFRGTDKDPVGPLQSGTRGKYRLRAAAKGRKTDGFSDALILQCGLVTLANCSKFKVPSHPHLSCTPHTPPVQDLPDSRSTTQSLINEN